MKIKKILEKNSLNLSYEIFPPKAGTPISSIIETVEQIAGLGPDFISVTYGASGSNSKNTLEVAEIVQDNNVTALAHLTCVASTKSEIKDRLDAFRNKNIENILALRGDIPEGSDFPDPGHYTYAADLIEDIHLNGNFSVGAACYPEGHIECGSLEKDMQHLKQKTARGVDFLITQMFFDNSSLYRFLDRAEKASVYCPVLCGIMPVTNSKMIIRSCKLSGASVPRKLAVLLDKYSDDNVSMSHAGTDYAIEQIMDLMDNGIRGIHLYTMNKPSVAQKIYSALNI